MGIERGDGDAAAGQAETLQRLVGEVDHIAQALGRELLRHVLKRDVGGDMAYTRMLP